MMGKILFKDLEKFDFQVHIFLLSNFFIKHYSMLEFLCLNLNMSLVVRKPVFGVSDQAPHKPGCTATQDG